MRRDPGRLCPWPCWSAKVANHDRAYKKLFHQKRMMTDLLELIEEDWVRGINCKSLKQAPTAQVSDHLR